MIFPPRRQLNESRRQVYRHGRAQGSDCDRGPRWRWQAGDGVHRRNQSQQHSAVYPRNAGVLEVHYELSQSEPMLTMDHPKETITEWLQKDSASSYSGAIAERSP